MGLTDLLKSLLDNFNVVSLLSTHNLERKISIGEYPSKQEFYRQFIHPRESSEVKNLYVDSINSPLGMALNFLLDKKGYAKRMPGYYIYLDMPNNILAATIKVNDGTVILAYNQRHANLLRNSALQRLYVNLHEHAHVRGVISEKQTDFAVENAALDLVKAYDVSYTNRLLPSGTSFKNRLNEYIDAIKIALHARLRQVYKYT